MLHSIDFQDFDKLHSALRKTKGLLKEHYLVAYEGLKKNEDVSCGIITTTKPLQHSLHADFLSGLLINPACD